MIPWDSLCNQVGSMKYIKEDTKGCSKGGHHFFGAKTNSKGGKVRGLGGRVEH